MNSQISTKQSKPLGLALQPQNIQEAMQMAAMISNSQLAPNSYRGKPEDTLVAMMMGSEIGLNPMQALQNIAVINGRPAVWGDAMLALVQNHYAFGGIKEDFDDKTMTASCTVWRKSGDRHIVYFSQQDAVAAKLWGKQGPWQQYPKRMLALRARGFALRDQFADALLGLISAEEARDIPDEAERFEQTGAIKSEPKQVNEQPQFMDQEQFESLVMKYGEKVANGEKSAKELIGWMQSKAPLTQEQISHINLMEQAA